MTDPNSGAADLPEALHYANTLDTWAIDLPLAEKIAAELRRLHTLTEQQQRELIKESHRTAEQKLRADQMTEQHRHQAALNTEARAQLAALTTQAISAEPAGAARVRLADAPTATGVMVDAYLKAQREAVEEADRFGRPNVGGLHTNTVREACRAGLNAALEAGGIEGKYRDDNWWRGWNAAIKADVDAEQPAQIRALEGLVLKWRNAAEHLGLEGLASLSDCADELDAAIRASHGQAPAQPHEQIAAYLEATDSYVTNDATREAAIAEAIAVDRASNGEAPTLPWPWTDAAQVLNDAINHIDGQDRLKDALRILAATPTPQAADTGAAQGTGITAGPEQWHPMETAPKDGTLVRLLVEFEDGATEDGEGPHPTIGSNTWDNHHQFDEWQFAGWNWSHDCYTQGVGKAVGWLPMLAAAPQPAPPADSVLEDAARLKVAVGLLEELAEHDSYSTEYDGRMVSICPECGEQEGEHRPNCAFVRAKAYLAARKQGGSHESQRNHCPT